MLNNIFRWGNEGNWRRQQSRNEDEDGWRAAGDNRTRAQYQGM